jgi:hypothetical protein
LEDIIAAIADWKNRDCLFMFAGAWTFHFTGGQTNVHDRLRVGNEEYVYYLQKHHGIALNWHQDFKTSDIDTIIHEVKNNTPVIIHLDSFYCPWHMYYGKNHSMHFCLLIGFHKNGFRCIDPYLTPNIEDISMNDVLAGCKEYALIEFHDCMAPYMDSLQSIIHSIHTAMDSKKSIFKQMELFGTEILVSDNMLIEIMNTQDIIESTIIEKIKFIGLGRRNYAKLIYEVGKHFTIPDLLHVSQPIDKLSSHWEQIKWLLVKCKIVKDKHKIIYDISNMIKEISCNEKKLMCHLLDIVQKNKERMVI